MTIPNWQTKFRDLPEIPTSKRWTPNLRTTQEQSIAFKLLNNRHLTEDEIYVFLVLTNFYGELYDKLSTLDYSTFTDQDISNFKNYILYAFNYNALITNDLTIFTTYRLVVNEHVSKQDKRITNRKFLTYPDLDLVKRLGKYNRSNTPSSNLFYSTENIDTALKEIRPPLNKLVTVGVWEPKTQMKFLSYPIFHNEEIVTKNYGAGKAMNSFQKHFQHVRPLLLNYMQYYFKLLGREYSKRINHHYEYMISALFSEQIFKGSTEDHLKYDCIIYPSVGNNHITDNIAMLPAVLDKNFRLIKVIEFVVEESYYDNDFTLTDPELITLAKIRDIHETKNIADNGQISW